MLVQTTICPARWPSPPISEDMTMEETAAGEPNTAIRTAISTGPTSRYPILAAARIRPNPIAGATIKRMMIAAISSVRNPLISFISS